MMFKSSSASDFAGLASRFEHSTQLIKVSRFGLMPNDAADMRKIAGDDIVDQLRKFAHDPNCEYVHQVAMGCYELFGQNRNGDGFRGKMLDVHHPQFVKYARAYRHHKNKDPDESYGRPVLSAYDPSQGFVRLITQLNKNAAACRKHGGKVADLELEALAKHGGYADSQGISVPYDECYICGNRAKTRAEYCLPKTAGGKCELFGCRTGMSKLADDGRMQGVDNPCGKFHDISYVGTGADRIAFTDLIDKAIFKAASVYQAGAVMGSAAISELMGWTPGYVDLSQDLPRNKLAAVDNLALWAAAEQEAAKVAANEFLLGLQFDDSHPTLVKIANYVSQGSGARCVSYTDALAAQGVAVPPRAFLAACGLTGHQLDLATASAGTVLGDLHVADRLNHWAASNKYAEAPFAYCPALPDVSEFVLEHSRILRNAMRKLGQGHALTIKSASAWSGGQQLTSAATSALDTYAQYKLRTLQQISRFSPEAAKFVLTQAYLG